MSRTKLVIGLLVLLALIAYPLFVPRYWILSIGAQSIILGIAALSLVFMAGAGGMISLSQAAIAALGSYGVAIASMRFGIDPLLAGAIGLMAATLAGAIFGAISARSYGLYFLMLTLALAVGVYYFVEQNYDIFKGHIGFIGIVGPTGLPYADPVPFFYLCLGAAFAVYLGLAYLARSPLGISFQAIRDNPRRARALGYWVGMHRVVIFALGGFVAGISGVLHVWYQGAIAPGNLDLTRTIDVLVIAVVGGISYPVGAFIGAVFFVLVQTFASDVNVLGIDFTQRFDTLIGLSFLLVVLLAPTGITGMADRAIRALLKRVRSGAGGAASGSGSRRRLDGSFASGREEAPMPKA